MSELDRIKAVRRMRPIGFEDAFKCDLTRHLVADMKERAETGHNFIASFIGDTGCGKSRAAMWAAIKLRMFFKRKWDIGSLYFDVEDLLADLPESKKGDVFVLDEQTSSFGPGSYQRMVALSNVEETVRQEQVNFLYCSPFLKIHAHHYVFDHAHKEWGRGRNVWYLKTGASQTLLGVVRTGLPKIDKKAYEERKRGFINSQKVQESGTGRVIAETAGKFLKECKLLGEFKSKAELKTEIFLNYNKNFTGEQVSMVADRVALLARERGIPLFLKDKL